MEGTRLTKGADIRLIPVTPENICTYIKLGTTSYNEHYRHLWPNGDTSPYINSGFTEAVLAEELENEHNAHYIIRTGADPVGILKLIYDEPIGNYPPGKCVLLEKIYMLNSFSGRGIGKGVLRIIEDKLLEEGKEILWLDTMQKGPALSFYRENGFSITGEKQLHFEKAINDEKPMYILMKPLSRPSGNNLKK